VKKQPKSWLVFVSLSSQIGLLFYLAVFFGQKLDDKQANETKIWTLLFCVLALIASLYIIQKQSKKFEE